MPSRSSSSSWYWIAIRRFRRDPVARAHLLQFAARTVLWLSPVILLLGWLTFKLLQIVGFSFVHTLEILGPLLLFLTLPLLVATFVGESIGLALALILRWPLRAVGKLLQSMHVQSTLAVSSDLKRMLHREACLIAALLERLGSETYLHEKELPPNIVVTTRRVLLDRLASMGLRDELDPWMLDLLLPPDGHWTNDQIHRTRAALESCVVFLWALGLSELDGLTDAPTYDLNGLKSVFEVAKPEELVVPPSWDLRLHRNYTYKFVNRCWSELLARGAVDGAPEEIVEGAVKLRSAIVEQGYAGDYLVGARTVPELETPLLWSLFIRADSRWRMLAVLVEVTAGEEPAASLRDLFRAIIAPAA